MLCRKTIIGEISETMKGHSINVDMRHIMLMADVMTYKVFSSFATSLVVDNIFYYFTKDRFLRCHVAGTYLSDDEG